MATGPSPLEIISAKPAGDVHHLADEIQPEYLATFHGFRRQRVGINTAHGDFRFGVTLGFCDDQLSLE
mgnify:CR=1 FL=1